MLNSDLIDILIRLGAALAAGLAIGEITNLEPSTDGLFKTGEVALDERLISLTEVTVLVPVGQP